MGNGKKVVGNGNNRNNVATSFMILSRINKVAYLCLFQHANTIKHVHEHSCSSVTVFLSISAHLAQSFFLILNVINK